MFLLFFSLSPLLVLLLLLFPPVLNTWQTELPELALRLLCAALKSRWLLFTLHLSTSLLLFVCALQAFLLLVVLERRASMVKELLLSIPAKQKRPQSLYDKCLWGILCTLSSSKNIITETDVIHSQSYKRIVTVLQRSFDKFL